MFFAPSLLQKVGIQQESDILTIVSDNARFNTVY